jgi:hypothetical protein
MLLWSAKHKENYTETIPISMAGKGKLRLRHMKGRFVPVGREL